MFVINNPGELLLLDSLCVCVMCLGYMSLIYRYVCSITYYRYIEIYICVHKFPACMSLYLYIQSALLQGIHIQVSVCVCECKYVLYHPSCESFFVTCSFSIARILLRGNNIHFISHLFLSSSHICCWWCAWCCWCCCRTLRVLFDSLFLQLRGVWHGGGDGVANQPFGDRNQAPINVNRTFVVN